jgi:hypothetical protein
MANYLELATNRYPVSQSQIRSENPQTSYPASFPVPDGFAVVFPAPAPTVDPITQIAREIAPVLTNKGHYEQAYEIVDLDAETVAANQLRAKEQHNNAIRQQIAVIEAGQARAVREASLGKDKKFLQGIEDQVAALRGQLQ